MVGSKDQGESSDGKDFSAWTTVVSSDAAQPVGTEKVEASQPPPGSPAISPRPASPRAGAPQVGAPAADAEATSGALLAFFSDQLTREYARRTALDAQAASVVSMSTTIATAAVTLSTFVVPRFSQLPAAAQGLLVAAVAPFAGAALTGLVGYWPRGTHAASVEALTEFHEQRRGESLGQAQAVFARYVLLALGPLRKGNGAKGRALRVAGTLQIIAVLALATAFAAAVVDAS